MSSETAYPWANSSLASVAVDLAVQRSRDIGFPTGLGLDQLVESFEQPGLFDLGLDVTATRGPLAVRRLDARLDLTGGLDHRVATHLGRLGDSRLATSPETDGHGAGHHPPLHLVQVRHDGSEKSREFIPTGLHLAMVLRVLNPGRPNGDRRQVDQFDGRSPIGNQDTRDVMVMVGLETRIPRLSATPDRCRLTFGLPVYQPSEHEGQVTGYLGRGATFGYSPSHGSLSSVMSAETHPGLPGRNS